MVKALRFFASFDAPQAGPAVSPVDRARTETAAVSRRRHPCILQCGAHHMPCSRLHSSSGRRPCGLAQARCQVRFSLAGRAGTARARSTAATSILREI